MVNFKNPILKLFISIIILLSINLLAIQIPWRIDLTGDKKFTLTESSVSAIKSISSPIDIEVYLEGNDLSGGILKLRNATEDLLMDFKRISKGKIQYSFIDINKLKNKEDKEALSNLLMDKGIVPTNLQIKKDDGYSEKLIFPGALIKSNSQTLGIQILESQISYNPNEQIENSFNNLEYKFVNTLAKANLPEPQRIGYITGHGELSPAQNYDFIKTLSQNNYKVAKIELSKDSINLKQFDLLLLTRPTAKFPEEDKILLDQYIMNGGKVIWMIDKAHADMDSLYASATFLATDISLNIDDLLFRYGVRIQPDLLKDLYCAPFPIVEEIRGNPITNFYPWSFYPLISANPNHSIGKRLDPILLRFASSIDTVGTKDIKKTILLATSQFSKNVYTPHLIDIGQAKIEPQKQDFPKSFIPAAVLLEGEFSSFYRNQKTGRVNDLLSKHGLSFRESSVSNKMIVISDGDFAKNDFTSAGVPMPLGYYKYTKETFGNKEFLLNSIEYLLDENGIFESRRKAAVMATLDKLKVKDQKSMWQIINIGLPIALFYVFGIFFSLYRKRKYGA
jgi:ABC-2 type transport system permease protein